MFNADAELLDYEAAMAELKISRNTLYRWVAAGRIAAIKHGRHSYIERAEIDAYWARQRDEALKARAARARAHRPRRAAPAA
jgi:excisionase family DNA binding protein